MQWFCVELVLFYAVVDELADITFDHALALIVSALIDSVREIFHATDEQIDDTGNRMPSDEEVKQAFHESILTNKYAAGVLYLIESKIRNRSMYSTALLGIGKYSLEHMMPKKWQNYWDNPGTSEMAKARDEILLTLGNLTIITQSLNASIRDTDWETKKAGKGDKGGLRKYAEGIETLSSFLDKEV